MKISFSRAKKKKREKKRKKKERKTRSKALPPRWKCLTLGEINQIKSFLEADGNLMDVFF